MAEIVRRRSWGRVLPLGRHVSISGSSLIQCASASMAPPHPEGAKCYLGEEVQARTGPRSRYMGEQPRRVLPRAAIFKGIVALCTHRPWPVVIIALASVLIGLYVMLTRFA